MGSSVGSGSSGSGSGSGILGQQGEGGAAGSELYPSRDDFERNFDDLLDRDSSNDDGGTYLSDKYENKVDYAGQDGDAEDGDEGEGEEDPLASGIYLAYSVSNLKGLQR
ncbi:hypothetical protein M422DRAFT_268150 [Sphaerobolus stellatus SS14]|uniref:Uncharacterized protein n=1 Tax=Sphaerobolus stellatus (strain SS14) TaxID=990650 RepID=A0A0C9UZ55_SPHS4|nr:hypothetical protein M422DRAFT_268150 [Sphaerobolus stellatus SS14]